MTIGRSQMRKQISNHPQKKKWYKKRKSKKNCARPKAFSEKAHCASRRKKAR